MQSQAVPEQDGTRPSGSDPPGAIFARFLKFGALAWGGPAAQIAMIKQDCVDEERWVDEETFKKTLAVYQVLRGPEAHELCVYFGRIRGGKLGGLLAGLGFMLPGFVLMLSLSVWLTDGQFVDGLAMSGVLPAPLFIFSTFVGYIAGGLIPFGRSRPRAPSGRSGPRRAKRGGRYRPLAATRPS